MQPRNSGFTLVEVMVALAVVAVALPALLFTLYQQIDGTAYLRDRSFAQMVAANKMTELRLISRARSSLLMGTDSGTLELADREWHWRVATEATEAPEFYRVEVRVGLEEDLDKSQLHVLTAFMAADLAQDNDPATEQPAGGDQDEQPGDAGAGDADGGAPGTSPEPVIGGAGQPVNPRENFSDVD